MHAIQQARLDRFGVTQSVDIHCHILHGIDDGPEDLEATFAVCRALMRDGITTVIATPHQLGRYEGQNFSADVRRQVAELQIVLDGKNIPLKILSGGEVRIDQRLPKFLADDRILTLADTGKYLLLELPSSVAIDPAMLMPMLEKSSVTVVLAHAERYEHLHRDAGLAGAWVDAGAKLQLNAGGLTGLFGLAAATAAWDWLTRGWISLVATDAHSVGTRRPRMTQAIDAISKKLGEAVARRVCIDNPIRVVEGAKLI